MSRLRRAFGVGTLAALAAIFSAATAAHAANQPSAKVFTGSSSIAPGASSEQLVYVFGSGTLHNVTLTYDLSALPTGVTAGDQDPVYNCDHTGSQMTCTLGSTYLDHGYYDGMPLVLTAGAGATGIGTLKVTVDSDETDPFSISAAVRVAEGVDLSAGANIDATAKPGDHVGAKLTVGDSGANTVHGAVLVTFGEDALEYGTRYSNCVYVGALYEAYCTFDEDLNSGQIYGLSQPLDLRVAPDTQAPLGIALDVSWYTPQDWSDQMAELTGLGISQDGPHGDKPALTLVAVAQPKAATTLQTDVNPSDNFSEVTVQVTGTNLADFQAIGATVQLNQGATATVKVGLKNNGPAAIRMTRSGSPAYGMNVTFPAGTTTTDVPDNCYPIVGGSSDWGHPGQPGHNEYSCSGYDKVAAGDSVLLTFTLRAGKDLVDAKGTIEVSQPTPTGIDNTWDHDLSNNTADIVINPNSAGSLPVTGTNAIAIGVAGLLVMTAGAALLWFGRRRRAA